MSQDPHTRLRECLADLYGARQAAIWGPQLLRLLESFTAHRGAAPPPASRPLSADDVILITYGDQIRSAGAAPLKTLDDTLAAIFADVFSGVHILPCYPATSDDGFSVADYLSVDPALGDWADVERLAGRYRLMLDAVVNHISVSSRWFQEFLAGAPGAADRFHVIHPALDLSAVTRPRTTPLLTPFTTPTGTAHVWTTFSADQVDLNYASPALLLEMTEVLLAYVAHGAGMLRLDAIGYLWKEIGTRCIHLPQAHRVVQLWRAVLDLVAPEVLLITETNVPHADNISYFGDGANEAQLVYQFPLAPLVLHTFATGDARRLGGWLATIAPPRPGTAFFNFLASHDGIGVVPATGILSPSEISALCSQIIRHGGRVSYKTNPDGTQSPYELNCTWFDALNNPFAQEPATLPIDRFVASQAIMLAIQGVPGVYVHSMIGSGNDHVGLAHTGRARSLNREKWELANLEARLAHSRRHEGAVLQRMARLIRARRAEPAFHPDGAQRVLEVAPALLAVERRAPDHGSAVLCLHNVSDRPQHAALPADPSEVYQDLLSDDSHQAGAAGTLTVSMEPYQVRWLRRNV